MEWEWWESDWVRRESGYKCRKCAGLVWRCKESKCDKIGNDGSKEWREVKILENEHICKYLVSSGTLFARLTVFIIDFGRIKIPVGKAK